MKNKTMRVPGVFRVLCCGSAVLFGTDSASAGSGAWNDAASGNWNDSAKWVGGTIPSGAGSVATFTNGTAATVNQNVPGLTLGGFFFANGLHTVTNNAITLDNNASPATVTVGIRDADTTRAVLAVPLNGTGGLAKRGAGRLDLTAATPGTLAGPVAVDGGTLFSSAANGTPLGTGSAAVNGGLLNLSPAGSGQNVALAAASGSTNATFAYSGAATLGLAKGANTSLTLTLGNAGAEAGSVLTRTNNGVLIVAPANGTSPANLGVAESLLVNGGAPANNGMVSASIVGRDTGSAGTGDFLTYGTNGFATASYTDGLGGGSASIANLTATTTTDNASVYALRVNSGMLLTVNSGKTLTVGDGTRPAGLILNNTGKLNTVISNGVLDFGTSEGIVYFNGTNTGGALQTVVYSSLAGQNGITFAGLSPLSEINLNPSGGNPYTGGTRILSGRVGISQPNCLGGGDITVLGHEGWGGQLYPGAAMTITNALHISGLTGHAEGNRFGAIRFGANSQFTGPVELLGDTRVAATQPGTVGTFSGPISGPWRLEAGGEYPDSTSGTIVLTGTNTYTGGTRVHRGLLKVGTGGTLGTGPVENFTRLVFDSASTVEVTNLLSGAGALTHQGAGTLKLGRVPNYAGPLLLNGTLDLCGSSAAFGALSGVGRVVNPSGPDLVLTVGSANTNTVFSGRIDDGISLVKTGTGTLTLFNTNRYSGATTVSGGTLKMANSVSDIAGLSYRLDASKTDSLTLSGTNVTAWADADGRAVTFSQATANQQPVLIPDSINGLPALRFGFSETSKRLNANASAAAQTVFIVNRMTSGAQGHGIWGWSGNDLGIRARSNTQWQHTTNGGNSSEFTWLGEMYINGVPGTTFVTGVPHILTAVSSNQVNWTAALGHYYTAQATRFFRGEIGEVLVFNRVLSPVERQSVVGYLAQKWLNDASISPMPDMLPAATALTLSVGGILDLNGVNQTVASLYGDGTLRNSNPVACTLTVGGDNSSCVFAGTINGALSLKKTGSGTLTLNGTSIATGATVIESGTLKLGEWVPKTGLSYRLDATEASTITRSGSNVTAWADSNGSALKFTQATTNLQPVYLASSAINGRPAVRFAQTERNRMAANIATNAQTVFIVYQMNAYGGTDGIWGKDMEDYGIRATDITSWQRGANASDFTYLGDMYIDGVPGNTFTAYQPHVLTAVSSNQVKWITAIGNYWGTSTGLTRYFRGDIGEILAYDRKLSLEERVSVETYLNLKWIGSGVTSRLSTNSAVTVATGATLNLNGVDQTLASLSGGGSVINGTVTVSGQTAPGGDGTVGTLALPDGPALSGTLRIDVRPDGTCDRLDVSGDLNVSQLALVIADTGQLNSGSIYTIATCTGTLSGSFTSHNLPQKNWAVRYIRTAGAGKILLAPRNGLVISLR